MILKAEKILNSLSVEQFLFQLNFFSAISFLNAIAKNLSKKKSSENFYVMP